MRCNFLKWERDHRHACSRRAAAFANFVLTHACDDEVKFARAE